MALSCLPESPDDPRNNTDDASEIYLATFCMSSADSSLSVLLHQLSDLVLLMQTQRKMAMSAH